MPDGLRFSGKDLEDLGRDLRLAADQFREEVDVTLVEIGEELKEAAKALAGAHSKTVADTIKLKSSPGFVVISAGDDSVPIAALWEMGNKGTHDTGRARGVWFRHPVFGTDVWTNQRRYPFLRPALEADRRNITKRMEATWDRALEPYRLAPG
jgi:hypothetical protein